MYLDKLSLTNYKNYREVSLDLSAKINSFVGQNGVGKTNLLDAIYFLSMTKSYLNPIDHLNIHYDEDFAILQGEFMRLEKREKIYCSLERNKKKRIKRDKKDYKKLSTHIGLLPVVMISPTDSNLILGGSEERRKYMDRVISQFDKEYLNALINYNRALNQRNQLLKDFARRNYFDAESLDIWDEQLITLGNIIYQKRSYFTEELVPVFQNFYKSISNNKEQVTLEYYSPLSKDSFRKLLTDSIEKDRVMQHSTIGTHKDDLLLKIDDHSIKKSGSQGQQKTFLVSLKFAQYKFMKRIKEFNPILLLDDIFDKFDKSRVEKIIGLVSDNNFGQIFITDTSETRLINLLDDKGINYKLFLIEKKEGNTQVHEKKEHTKDQ